MWGLTPADVPTILVIIASLVLLEGLLSGVERCGFGSGRDIHPQW